MLRLLAAAGVCLVLGVAQCYRVRQSYAPGGRPRVLEPKPVRLTDAQCAAAHVNELGVVPIVLYTDISTRRARTSRSPTQFRADLERLYREGYRPLSLHAYLANRIDTPAGFSPVIFTFDESRGGQFRLRADGTTDPDCGIGIWQAFARTHPDFPVRAAFFPALPVPFGEAARSAQKLQTLIALGCEIGSRTATGADLSRLPDDTVQREIATSVILLQRLAPNALIETAAPPLGRLPRNHSLALTGAFQEVRYLFHGVLRAGAAPARSPASRKFDPLRIARIVAVDEPFGLNDWLDKLRQNPSRRYVSDGDPETVAIPRTLGPYLASERLQGAVLRSY